MAVKGSSNVVVPAIRPVAPRHITTAFPGGTRGNAGRAFDA